MNKIKLFKINCLNILDSTKKKIFKVKSDYIQKGYFITKRNATLLRYKTIVSGSQIKIMK